MPTADLPRMFNLAGIAAVGMITAVVVSFLTGAQAMTTSEFDSFRPPSPAAGVAGSVGAAGRAGRSGRSADGSREMPMVPEAEFTSYYGRPVVKAPPWGHEIPAYLFLGGVAGGSAPARGRRPAHRTTRRCDATPGSPGSGQSGSAVWPWCSTWAGPNAS